MDIKKRDSLAILNALTSGVVPSRGLQYITVGRVAEMKQIASDLDSVKEGGSIVKFFIGPFGSGKSFIQAILQQIAFSGRFVVARADFTPERRLYDGDGRAVSLYSELIKNLSIQTMPEGNALPNILERWINDVQTTVVSTKGYGAVSFDDPQFVRDVEAEITKTVNQMDHLTGGFDFARIIAQYYRGFVEDNSELQRAAIRWLRGEYQTKTEARHDLGVREIIDDNNYYDYLKLLSQFVRQIGYSGLVVNLDEAINLYKINHQLSREKNYESILKIFNDTIQGALSGLYITFSGTPEFLEDERRGVFSYGALKRRVIPNQFETLEYRDLAQPVIRLTPLKIEETYVLLAKVRDIHATHNGYESRISDSAIESFLKTVYSRPGAVEHLTAGEVVRQFIGGLNILYQNADLDPNTVFTVSDSEAAPPTAVNARFKRAEF